MAQMFFNPAEHKESQNNFDPIPEGWYTAQVTESSIVETKAGTGKYLKLQFQIIAPTNAGRTVFMNLNLWNSNEKAVEIANGQMKQLLDCIGLGPISDSAQIHGRPVNIKVVIETRDNYAPQNQIKGFKPATAAPATASAQASPQPATASPPPWAK